MLEALLSVLPAPPRKPKAHSQTSSFLPELPRDFLEFIETYGGGVIGGHIFVYEPGHPSVGGNMENNARSELAAMESLHEQFPDLYLSPRFPESGGFLPWGRGADGDDIFGWMTLGKSSDWMVSVIGEEGERSDFHVSFVAFLTDLLSGATGQDLLPSDFFDSPVRFEPFAVS